MHPYPAARAGAPIVLPCIASWGTVFPTLSGGIDCTFCVPSWGTVFPTLSGGVDCTSCVPSWGTVFLLVLLLLVCCICSVYVLSLIHISEPTRRTPISYAVFC